MLFRVGSKNSETIQISHFSPTDASEDKDACVLVTFEVLIPYDSGQFAAAAMVKGLKEFFLDSFMKPESYNPAEREMFTNAENTLAGLEKAIVPDNVSSIVKP